MILSTSFFSTPESSLTFLAFKGSSEFLNASITLSLSDFYVYYVYNYDFYHPFG